MTPAYEGDPAEPKLVPPGQWFTPPAQQSADAPRLAGGVGRQRLEGDR